MGKVIDLTGKKFGRLTVLSQAKRPVGAASTSAFWLCKCECGTEKVISGNVLRQGKAKSCGCYNKEYHYENTMDLTNQRFGHLIALKRVPRPEELRSGGAYWLCKCDCGKEKIILGKSLRTGKTKSCGKCRVDVVDDLTGQKFGKLTVLERDFSRPSNNDGAFWRCKCECGNETIVLGKNLKQHNCLSCGCLVSYGENIIKKILQDNNINFKTQYSFQDLYGLKGGLLRFDFAIFDEENNIQRLIEYQGQQHYENSSWFDVPFEHDKMKRQYCKNNNYILVCIPYWKRDGISLKDIMGDKYIVDLTDEEVES